MTKDVDELVLDAFRIEHREQLDQIREILGSLPSDAIVGGDARVRNAFRLAHSFKGGARVCDLRDAEQLGHGLEAVLERLSRGELSYTKDVTTTVNLVLDCIEDWMAALDQEQPPPDVSEALAAVERALGDAAGSAPEEPPAAAASATTRLMEVFCKEFEQHTACLRRLLAHWANNEGVADDDMLAEAMRVAHTLAGAASAVEIEAVELGADQLERLFQSVRANRQPLDATIQRQIAMSLDAMATTVHEMSDDPNVVQSNLPSIQDHFPNAKITSEGEPCLETTAPSVQRETADSQAVSALETVRISVESLDRLMLSSSAMSAENQRVARLTRQLKALQFDVNELNRECESFRRAASASVHRLSMTPEFARIAQYLELIDRSSSALVKKTRQLMAEQRRVAWRLRAGSGQVQRDVHSARLVPAHSVFQGFRKMVRDLAKSQGKEIEFQTIGMNVRADRMVLQELKDPIMHLLRNCVSHGVESPAQRRAAGKPEIGCVSLSLEISGGRLVISIDDDGPGIDELAVRRQAVRSGLLSESAAENLSSAQTLSLVFAPGFSTADAVTELAGRGMGLSIVYDSATRLQGQISLSNRSQSGVRATLSAPVFVSTHRVLLVACGQQTFAIPTHGIERLLRVRRDKTETMEGRPVVTHERRPIRLVRLIDVLGLPNASDEDDQREVAPVVVLKSGDRFLAASVDSLVEERDALILNLDEFSESRLLAGGVLLDDASVALVVQPAALIDNARRDRAFHMPPSAAQIKPIEATKVLIVDDSFTTRTLEKNILESHGFEVGVAMDGVEALSLLREQKFALVISDVEMPRMDGFSLLEEIKSDRRLAGTPVILVTSRDRPEDRRRGLYLGADAYIVKRKFDHQELLGTIRQLT